MAAEAEEEDRSKRSTRTLVRVLAPARRRADRDGQHGGPGALPHTVQKAVSHAAGAVGLNLPGDDETQGDNNDDQGDNNNQGEDTQGDTQTNDTSGEIGLATRVTTARATTTTKARTPKETRRPATPAANRLAIDRREPG